MLLKPNDTLLILQQNVHYMGLFSKGLLLKMELGGFVKFKVEGHVEDGRGWEGKVQLICLWFIRPSIHSITPLSI